MPNKCLTLKYYTRVLKKILDGKEILCWAENKLKNNDNFSEKWKHSLYILIVEGTINLHRPGHPYKYKRIN